MLRILIQQTMWARPTSATSFKTLTVLKPGQNDPDKKKIIIATEISAFGLIVTGFSLFGDTYLP